MREWQSRNSGVLSRRANSTRKYYVACSNRGPATFGQAEPYRGSALLRYVISAPVLSDRKLMHFCKRRAKLRLCPCSRSQVHQKFRRLSLGVNCKDINRPRIRQAASWPNFYVATIRRIDFSEFHDALIPTLEETWTRYFGSKKTQHPFVKRANLLRAVTSLAIRAHIYCVVREESSNLVVFAGINKSNVFP